MNIPFCGHDLRAQRCFWNAPRTTCLTCQEEIFWHAVEPLTSMDLLSNTLNCGLCMRRECQERFTRHQLQRKPLVSDPGMHQSTCVTHVPWCMSGSLTCGGGENVPGTCATRYFTYLIRDPCQANIRKLAETADGAQVADDCAAFIEFTICATMEKGHLLS